MTNAIVIMSTLFIGGLVMYWLQNWTGALKHRERLSLVQPVVMQVVKQKGPQAPEITSAE